MKPSPDFVVHLILTGGIGVIAVVVLVLAAVPAIRARSWRPCLPALGWLTLFLIIPLPVFLLSGFLSPDSKRACHVGWVDCITATKLWLTPLVLWAIAGLYVRDVLRRPGSPPRWSQLGILWGAIVSGFCLVHFVGVTLGAGLSLRSIHGSTDGIMLFLLIPCYVHAWFLWRSRQLWRERPLSWRSLAAGLGLGLPCWIAMVIQARRVYEHLPETNGCFVVTAASHGHRRIVGPVEAVLHRGRVRYATSQLATFWAFETLWQRVSPASHTAFRRAYNRVGPRVARTIRGPWLADLVCLLLKPFELLARLAVRTAGRRDFQSLEVLSRGTSNHWKSP